MPLSEARQKNRQKFRTRREMFARSLPPAEVVSGPSKPPSIRRGSVTTLRNTLASQELSSHSCRRFGSGRARSSAVVSLHPELHVLQLIYYH
ncbi:hypothetical protein GWI33_019775 [Rhynchophorus ferrugineus]|uniref:Uncharacterized protein n=1 Tax=Rhynchophorus ferrugineus TaxID=354439 RepID=A0A834M4Y1_RHYFE|nr:hypothetical protein GWI33_019775 [Rhynchophorus ferrugineus]